MSPLHQILDKLNSSSKKILANIEREELYLDDIKTELNQRDEFVKELGLITDKYPYTTFTDEERGFLRSKFDLFVKLNNSIQAKLENQLNHQQEKIATASKQRKIEEQYSISKTPDISYF